MPGSLIAAGVFGLVSGTFAYAATAFAINIVASAIISKAFGAKAPNTNALFNALSKSISPFKECYECTTDFKTRERKLLLSNYPHP